ncbi:MAG: apolipoprotein N-acyltransferase [Roseimicrobium sp.]
MKTLTRPFLAVLSGLVLTTAYPRWNVSAMVWLWIFPLLFALWSPRAEDAQKRNRGRRGFVLGYLAGLAFFMTNLSWVRHSSRVIAGAQGAEWMGWGPELLGLGAVLGLSVYLALYWGLWAAFAATIGRPRLGDSSDGALFSSSLESLRSAFLCAAAWVATEWLRGTVFTGFNWNGLGAAMHQSTLLIQGADVVGVTGLAFLPVFFACIGYNTVLRFRQEVRTSRVRPHADFWCAAVLLVVTVGYGAARLVKKPGESIPLRVLLVQPNVPQAQRWEASGTPELMEQIYHGLGRLTQIGVASAKPDLVIWPESAIPAPFHDPNHIPFLDDLLKLDDFTLLSGADILVPGEPFATGAALMRGSFENHQLYRKVHLVPFGEYLPLRDVPGVQSLLGDVIPGDFTPGTSTEPFTLEKPAGVQLIPLVCFEDTDGRLARKFVRDAPQLLVNLTNDGWFLHSNENEVHLANAIFRCVELRRPMVRSCNTGVTCYVDSLGRIARGDTLDDPKTGSVFVKGVLPKEVAVPKHPERTFYAQYGDVFSHTMLALSGLAVLGAWLRSRATSPAPSGS